MPEPKHFTAEIHSILTGIGFEFGKLSESGYLEYVSEGSHRAVVKSFIESYGKEGPHVQVQMETTNDVRRKFSDKLEASNISYKIHHTKQLSVIEKESANSPTEKTYLSVYPRTP